ncbi:MAG TPA: hypothetical protein VGL57_05585 [Solirubrobacteraceae bacterium]|jgi:hypothetical protein
MDNETVLPLVLYGTTAVYVVSGLLSMISRPNLYDQIGQGGLSDVREDRVASDALRERSVRLAAERAESEQDVRQMLQARNARLERDGQPPLDVEAELLRLDILAANQPDDRAEDLVEEVRQLTIARNERRARQGLELLDVDDEIQRAMGELELVGSAPAASARED